MIRANKLTDNNEIPASALWARARDTYTQESKSCNGLIIYVGQFNADMSIDPRPRDESEDERTGQMNWTDGRVTTKVQTARLWTKWTAIYQAAYSTIHKTNNWTRKRAWEGGKRIHLVFGERARGGDHH